MKYYNFIFFQFLEEFLHSQNSLTDEQKKLFLELTSLQGDYEKMDLLKIVQTPDLVNQIITVVKEILKKRNVPDKVIDFYVTVSIKLYNINIEKLQISFC